MITALLMGQFIAFPAAMACNWFALKIGTKKAVLIAIGGYSLITLLAYFMTHKIHFYMLAAVIGPVLMGWVTLVTGNVRLGILSIIVLFINGGFLLNRVDFEKGEELAEQFSSE